MFPKNLIDSEKLNPDTTFFKEALAPTHEVSKLLYLLGNLGRLPAGFKGDVFIPFGTLNVISIAIFYLSYALCSVSHI